MEGGSLLFGPAFIAGVLMFLAPCTLPLVPAYLAFISGVRPDDRPFGSVRVRIIKNSLAYVLGFSVTFIAFGILAGSVGHYLSPYRVVLAQLGGVLIILFGLLMLGALNFSPLNRRYALPLPRSFTPGTPLHAFLIGTVFALGWTPCVGPILASVLLLASTTATATTGALLLGVFSLGLALPFLLTAFLYARVSDTIRRYSVLFTSVNIIGGLFLIGIGVLLSTGSFGTAVEYGYRVFYWFGFEALFDYL